MARAVAVVVGIVNNEHSQMELVVGVGAAECVVVGEEQNVVGRTSQSDILVASELVCTHVRLRAHETDWAR